MPTLADYPHLVAQLDARRNGPLAPEEITYASNRKLWWRCPEGPDHLWLAAVSHRTTRGDRCPFCVNQRVSVTNALSKRAPAVARQWHPTRNGDLRPKDVVVGSHKRVWWKCPKGPDHAWQTTVDARTTGGRGCPFCSGYRASQARNFAVVSPHLISRGTPPRTAPSGPMDVSPYANRKVWWRVPRGARSRVAGDRRRSDERHGVPLLRGQGGVGHQRPVEGGARGRPPVAPDHERRSPAAGRGRRLAPARVVEVPERARPRVAGDRRRPDRRRERLPVLRRAAGDGARATSPSPRLTWSPSGTRPRTATLRPEDVAPRSSRPVWWRCARGHEWSRLAEEPGERRHGVPVLLGPPRSRPRPRWRRSTPPWRSSGTRRRTAPSRPRDVTLGSGVRVWWKCPEGREHVWRGGGRAIGGAGAAPSARTGASRRRTRSPSSPRSSPPSGTRPRTASSRPTT